MKIDDKIGDKKLQQGIKREAAKISALSSDIIDKYQYLEGEEIIPLLMKVDYQNKLSLVILLQEKLLKNK